MVSGSDVPKYKSKKTGYFQPTNNGNFKRYSAGNEPMRPWPPMYHDRDARMVDSKMYMVDHKNMKNNYKNSMYDSSEYNYYQNNRKLINGHGPEVMNGINGKATKTGHTQHNFGIQSSMSPVFSGRDDNLLMIANRDKYQLRKLRNPTQASSASSQSRTCPCTRSKSMEDIRASVVVERPTSYKENFVEHKLQSNNGKDLDKAKHSTRRSMDNLLRVDTNFGRHFQVLLSDDAPFR
ncbi:hypothetical protein Bhyg_09495 [Pseudolycoriella hygida]|uniref:Uncharacterized protein n=1 Tax=Pseudolycoriella hygida TaxID=35572 RepID=A0A9Q0N851_9DIPT|nr:hypothetical protein Bhyg_09495 [Pseudolycoriella hygida]